ncbi:MAG: hypothetical protein HDQ91_05485 [Desulfovibrio sp.]|nr:hypothetical protein [Desulfovibrio sp.]
MTKVRKFSSLNAAMRFARIGSGNYTYKDPEAARNWHHTFNSVWELKGRINRRDPIFSDRGTSCYPRNDADNLAAYIQRNGEEIPLEDN